MASRIPPLIEPYLALPPETSLILLTSVLEASTNWLVLRYLYSYLQPQGRDEATNTDTKVLLISFLRDSAFWKEGARKLGLDLDKLAAKKQFSFLDGLTGLFVPQVSGRRSQSQRSGVIKSAELETIRKQILDVVGTLRDGEGQESKIVLIIDQLDLLLATCGNKIIPVQLHEMVMDLQENVHCTIFTLAADGPLIAEQHTPLETNHSVFLLSLAHEADITIGLRLLDTGTAADVSGVIRITNGETEEAEGERRKLDDRELLYYVGQDGGVRVFERGQ